MSEQHQHTHDHDQNPLQPYFDWQVTTIMLASELVLKMIPDVYKNDPELAWPPEMLRNITRLTFDHVRDILKDDKSDV